MRSLYVPERNRHRIPSGRKGLVCAIVPGQLPAGMASPGFLSRLRIVDLDPFHWLRVGLKTFAKALGRLWGRDVMLYTGGVSFFALLAIFPALAILITVNSLLTDPVSAAKEGEYLA